MHKGFKERQIKKYCLIKGMRPSINDNVMNNHLFKWAYQKSLIMFSLPEHDNTSLKTV